MQIYQNNKLVATLEKAGACLGENKKTNKLEILALMQVEYKAKLSAYKKILEIVRECNNENARL